MKIREDIIHAVFTKEAKSSLEEKLEILGKLTVYTKQPDAVTNPVISSLTYDAHNMPF